MLDKNNVKAFMLQLAGGDPEHSDESMFIIDWTIRDLEDRLDAEKVGTEYIRDCEYAAACIALYEYICREAGREQVTVTAQGKADENADFTHRIRSAKELRDSALERIGRLMKGEDFLFKTMGGES